jgi:Ni/Co efflux regulator RcnB
MLKRKKILAGIFATVVALSAALPMSASAADDHWWDRNHHEHWDHHNDAHYREWAWQRDHDHYRAYTYAPGYGYHANGAGMVDPRNPRLMWACDSQGHHCHWAPR